ncbi:haloacid dehalogenase-like hydrolase [Candidatus Saccharibacteria bacterium]|nr:haloacid dehalogenase-like hydrolase [Candidatus Saccharibacteria bacterium]
MIKLVLTDFDGTLVAEDILDIICGINGKEAESKKLNGDFINGKADGLVSLKKRVDFLKGVSLGRINEKLNENKYLTNGAKELFEFLENNKIKTVLHSGNIIPVLDYYKNILDISYIVGNAPRMKGDAIEGIELEDFRSKNFKYDGCKEIIEKLGIIKSEILAIGDSPADSKVFKLAGTKVVINPKGGIEKEADYVVDNLFDVVDIINSKSLKELNKKFHKLQDKYGAQELDAICNGGCESNPDICFVFMNPTSKNIASSKNWKGIKSPWIGTKNIWDLFHTLNLLDKDIYNKIKSIKASEWTEQFAEQVYENIADNKCYITNLGKCTQLDARLLPDSVYQQYLDLFLQEIEIVKPKVIILFGNQVSSIVLDEKISVSQVRKKKFEKEINSNTYKFYSLHYPVGNGRFNIDKTTEDLEWIIENEIKPLTHKV